MLPLKVSAGPFLASSHASHTLRRKGTECYRQIARDAVARFADGLETIGSLQRNCKPRLSSAVQQCFLRLRGGRAWRFACGRVMHVRAKPALIQSLIVRENAIQTSTVCCFYGADTLAPCRCNHASWLTPERDACNHNRSAGAINYLQQKRTEGVRMCAPDTPAYLAQQIEDDDSLFTTVRRASLRAGCARATRVRAYDWAHGFVSAVLKGATVQHACKCMPASLQKTIMQVCAHVYRPGPPTPSGVCL